MDLNIQMSHFTVVRIFTTYNRFLKELIIEDSESVIPKNKNTLAHLYRSSPVPVQQVLYAKYPAAVKYATEDIMHFC